MNGKWNTPDGSMLLDNVEGEGKKDVRGMRAVCMEDTKHSAVRIII